MSSGQQAGGSRQSRGIVTTMLPTLTAGRRPPTDVRDTVLVTGATGFAGRHLLARLAGGHANLVAWHRPGRTEGPVEGLRWAAVDLLDASAVDRAMAEARPTTVYHCAGAAHTAKSWHDSAATLEINVLGTHRLLQAIGRAGLSCRVLLPGSALVYRPSDRPLTEDSPLGPRSPYATSKLAQELLGLSVARERGLPVFVTRSFNHVGPGQDPSFSASSFARQLARIEAGLEEPVLRVGNLDARRDLTDVRDVARAYAAIVEKGQPGRVYNVCSEQAHSMADILERLIARARVSVEVRPDPERMRVNDVPLLLGDARRVREETGWTPGIPIERTLADLLDYWRVQVRDRSEQAEPVDARRR